MGNSPSNAITGIANATGKLYARTGYTINDTNRDDVMEQLERNDSRNKSARQQSLILKDKTGRLREKSTASPMMLGTLKTTMELRKDGKSEELRDRLRVQKKNKAGDSALDFAFQIGKKKKEEKKIKAVKGDLDTSVAQKALGLEDQDDKFSTLKARRRSLLGSIGEDNIAEETVDSRPSTSHFEGLSPIPRTGSQTGNITGNITTRSIRSTGTEVAPSLMTGIKKEGTMERLLAQEDSLSKPKPKMLPKDIMAKVRDTKRMAAYISNYMHSDEATENETGEDITLSHMRSQLDATITSEDMNKSMFSEASDDTTNVLKDVSLALSKVKSRGSIGSIEGSDGSADASALAAVERMMGPEMFRRKQSAGSVRISEGENESSATVLAMEKLMGSKMKRRSSVTSVPEKEEVREEESKENLAVSLLLGRQSVKSMPERRQSNAVAIAAAQLAGPRPASQGETLPKPEAAGPTGITIADEKLGKKTLALLLGNVPKTEAQKQEREAKEREEQKKTTKFAKMFKKRDSQTSVASSEKDPTDKMLSIVLGKVKKKEEEKGTSKWDKLLMDNTKSLQADDDRETRLKKLSSSDKLQNSQKKKTGNMFGVVAKATAASKVEKLAKKGAKAEKIEAAYHEEAVDELLSVDIPRGEKLGGVVWTTVMTQDGDEFVVEGVFVKDRGADGREKPTGRYVLNSKWEHRYEGKMKNYLFSDGMMLFPNGDRYIGQWDLNRFHGNGLFHNNTGYRYNGQFKAGLKHGNGTLTNNEGDFYEGSFKADMMHGAGSLNYIDGRKYEGQFELDRRHGVGCMDFMNGKVYKGSWFDGQREGVGVEKKGGTTYKGDFRQNMKEGLAVVEMADGKHYEGVFRSDQVHEIGYMRYPDKTEYFGQFKWGLRSGFGELYNETDGTLIRGGFWKADELNNGSVDAAAAVEEAKEVAGEARARASEAMEASRDAVECTKGSHLLDDVGKIEEKKNRAKQLAVLQALQAKKKLPTDVKKCKVFGYGMGLDPVDKMSVFCNVFCHFHIHLYDSNGEKQLNGGEKVGVRATLADYPDYPGHEAKSAVVKGDVTDEGSGSYKVSLYYPAPGCYKLYCTLYQDWEYKHIGASPYLVNVVDPTQIELSSEATDKLLGNEVQKDKKAKMAKNKSIAGKVVEQGSTILKYTPNRKQQERDARIGVAIRNTEDPLLYLTKKREGKLPRE